MNGWLPAVLAALSVLGGGAGLVALLTVGATRRKMRADAEETLADTVRTLGGAAADLVEPLQRALDAAEARAETVNARLREARAEIDKLRDEAERAYGELRRLRIAILDPQATLERLRAMVDPGLNGRP